MTGCKASYQSHTGQEGPSSNGSGRAHILTDVALCGTFSNEWKNCMNSVKMLYAMLVILIQQNY